MFRLFDYPTGGKEKNLEAASQKETDDKREAAAQLSFDDAIAVHEKWKERLLRIVADSSIVVGSSSSELTALDVDTVRCDDKCALGKWIHGVAKDRFGQDETFVDLRGEHAEFHNCAANVIEHARKKRLQYSRLVIDGEFTRRSRKVVELLGILRGKYGV